MPTLALSSPLGVARSGSNKAWTNVGNVLASDDVYATSGTYQPGDVAELVRCNIAAPASAVPAIPTNISVSVEGHLGPSSDVLCDVAIDYVVISDAHGFTTANVSGSPVLTLTDAQYNFTVPSAGLNLADFNAGLMQLFVGFRAIPTFTYVIGDFAVSTTSVGNSIDSFNGTVPWTNATSHKADTGLRIAASGSASDSGTYTHILNFGPATKPTYGILKVVSYANTGMNGIPVPLTAGTSSANDGQGPVVTSTDTDITATSTTTAYYRVALSAGIGNKTISPAASASSTGNTRTQVVAETSSTPSVVMPTPSTAYADAFSVSYLDVSPIVLNHYLGGEMFNRVPSIRPGNN